MSAWRLGDIPDQSGRLVVVTGPSTGGLGHHTALELARRGARVVLAGRSPSKVEQTAAEIRVEVPGAELESLTLDLADLTAVREAAHRAADLGPIDVLVNNAGVMGMPSYLPTVDGIELQLATNHVGPFLFTGLLWPQLVEARGRVVSVASQMHRLARRAPVGDPRVPAGRYQPWLAYGETKLANLLFTAELARRAAPSGVTALAAHPGFAGTHLAANGQYGRSSGGVASVLDGAIKLMSQSAAAGAWPSLMAATADLPTGTYVGPRGPLEFAGRPKVTRGTRLARDPDAARRLWEISEQTTGVHYP
ncbi:SDR family NAD(P)-dependent oxidoreductase [Nocardioides sp. R-C-SC26]|uniref:SDR family NAD(P)-dependent oxidoreductase n=1 Tax=Nocardioides sp. R-C-SC26 TaxID=2870414 RepID=UPI001E417714|nr:SDR family NAD(P)-dependent oxidoreductase [Nocardioides sp. R-C-SC26]